jgi:hypothetical protein
MTKVHASFRGQVAAGYRLPGYLAAPFACVSPRAESLTRQQAAAFCTVQFGILSGPAFASSPSASIWRLSAAQVRVLTAQAVSR